MKTIASLLLLAISFAAVCQGNTSYGNFKLADQEILYQKVFAQDSITAEKLSEFYKAQTYVANLQTSGDEVTFDMNDIVVDYKKFQFTQVATPPIIQTGKYYGKVTVGVKDGKYRVTVRSIQMTGDIGYKKIPAKDNLTNYAAKNNGTIMNPEWCKPNTLGLLDKSFTDKLQFVDKAKKKDSDDW
ncbi:hypothetical protein [Chryseolinea lacunae]|uniref:DUF4468 domain-containing protein n=1 Tax=Chryseolinea lacunae TaxID=2801331 RepID=A0ABS1KWA4_9BACT|nr:hypothetical protein [Chryseolinea lacunae]MBL0743644.1 hypothetical protein [Chryseolinea lacunae]